MVSLKDGMIVVLADGSYGIVCGDYIYTDVLALDINRYADDYTYFGDTHFDSKAEEVKHELDIDMIYTPKYPSGVVLMLSCSFIYDTDLCECIWERSNKR